MPMPYSTWIGYDPREADAFAVARNSARQQHAGPVHAVMLERLQRAGLYTRPTEYRDGKIYDRLSVRADYDGEMSTEFAISRFFVPILVREAIAKHGAPFGWALFTDCDMLFRRPLTELWQTLAKNRDKAVMCVQHDYRPTEKTKMDGRQQTQYPRKNWSSVIAFNCDHSANRDALTLQLLNSAPGRDLHAFCWLKDDEIGALDPKWNYLVGHTTGVRDPAIVHFTTGIPRMAGHQNDEYAGEWRAELDRWTW